jgi:hypothetical protein
MSMAPGASEAVIGNLRRQASDDQAAPLPVGCLPAAAGLPGDLNLGPHPYQVSKAGRRAIQHIPRPCDSVDITGMG